MNKAIANTSHSPRLDTSIGEENKVVKASLRDEAYAGYTYAEIAEEQQKLNQKERENRERKRDAENNHELLRALDNYSGLFTELKELLAKRRGGAATQAELDRIEEVKKLREKELAHQITSQQSACDLKRGCDKMSEK